MKFEIRLCAALFAALPLSAAALVGTYEGTVEDETSRITIVLRCETHTACELETRSVERGAREAPASIHPFSPEDGDLEGARNALKFAREHLALAATPAYRGFANLAPLLESQVGLRGCSAMQSGNLICEPHYSPWNRIVVLYLAADLANCSDTRLFCAYVFVPLFQTSKVAKMTSTVRRSTEGKVQRPQRPIDIDTTSAEDYYWNRVGIQPEELAAASSETRRGHALLNRDRRVAEGYSVLRPEAERGETVAQVLIGVMYADGLGRRRDLNQALHWLGKADEKGSRSAAEAIGRIHDDGILVRRDIQEAKKWYAKAGQDKDRMSRYWELHSAQLDFPFLVMDPPNVLVNSEPRNWVALAQRIAYVYDIYEKLDQAVKLPSGFPKGVFAWIEIGVAPDGTVVSVERHLGWSTGSQRVSWEQLDLAYAAIVDGIRAASPLPMLPTWVAPGTKIRVAYPRNPLRQP